jgi:hypothetical protein
MRIIFESKEKQMDIDEKRLMESIEEVISGDNIDNSNEINDDRSNYEAAAILLNELNNLKQMHPHKEH